MAKHLVDVLAAWIVSQFIILRTTLPFEKERQTKQSVLAAEFTGF